MELNKIISLFAFCLIQVSYCTLKEILVIKYFPHQSHENPFVSLKPANKYILTSRGYTYCLRVNFWTWNKNKLILTETLALQLDPYTKGTGYVRDGEFTKYFEWKNLLQLSYFSWNSFCVSSYLSNLYLSINGIEVFNVSEGKQETEKIDASTIILGSSQFTGQISDLNIWNRSLSPEEILEYSLNCDSDFAQKSSPSILLWSLANVTIKGNASIKDTIPWKNLCQQNNESRPETKIVLLPDFLSYEFYSKHCQNLNGVMFYPQNEKDIQHLMNSAGSLAVNNKCSGKFWVPFVRSGSIESGWMYDTKKYQDKEHSFSLWMKSKLNETNMKKECMYFDILAQQFINTECSETESLFTYFCSFCEIDESRLVFKLQIDCANSKSNISTDYFLVPQNPGYYFSGVSGSTNIRTDDFFNWQLTLVQESNSSVVVVANIKDPGPIGVQTWSSQRFKLACKEKSSVIMKLSNVI